MVGRVSSFGQQQLLVRSIINNQARLFEDQRQVSTGKKADDFKGLAGQTGTILGARSFKSRIETYEQTISTIRGKLDANDVQIGGVFNGMEDLKESIQTVLANGQALGFEELMEQTFRFTVNSLNTNFDGLTCFQALRPVPSQLMSVHSRNYRLRRPLQMYLIMRLLLLKRG